MATSFFRRFTKRFFLILNCIFCGIFLIACLTPFLNPSTWWFMGFMGLMVPYLALILLLWIIFWWFVRPKYSWISIITLILGYAQLGVILAFNSPSEFNTTKQANVIRIADWNIRSFLGVNINKERRKHIKQEITDAIVNLQPDVICLQEFNHSYTQSFSNNLALFTSIYPYYHFSKDFTRDNGSFASGSIIFSKLPFIDTGRTKYPGRYGESLLYADVVNDGDTIRIFNTHLQSFKFNSNDYEGIEKIRSQDDETLEASKGLIRKMKLAFTRRAHQARIVKTEIYNSPHPTVIAGDFNDVPNSYTYFTIKGANKDAFLQKGFGIGRTYLSLAPTLRIDYILPDRRFDVLQFDMIDEGLSDHLLLVTDLQLKK